MTSLPIQLSEASGVPFYRQVVDQMSHLIRSGQIVAGERLPSVRELSRQLLVSLITIRRSYADLETARLIVRRQGQGTFVADKVETASREQAVEEAKARLAEALSHARQLGLRGAALRAHINALLGGEGETDGTP